MSERRARAVMATGALAAVLGIAFSGTAAPLVGGVFLVGGWIALAYGLHAFGRAGSA